MITTFEEFQEAFEGGVLGKKTKYSDGFILRFHENQQVQEFLLRNKPLGPALMNARINGRPLTKGELYHLFILDNQGWDITKTVDLKSALFLEPNLYIASISYSGNKIETKSDFLKAEYPSPRKRIIQFASDEAPADEYQIKEMVFGAADYIYEGSKILEALPEGFQPEDLTAEEKEILKSDVLYANDYYEITYDRFLPKEIEAKRKEKERVMEKHRQLYESSEYSYTFQRVAFHSKFRKWNDIMYFKGPWKIGNTTLDFSTWHRLYSPVKVVF